MEFCGNSTFDPWENGNFSPCFVYPVSSAVSLFYIIVAATAHCFQVIGEERPEPRRNPLVHLIPLFATFGIFSLFLAELIYSLAGELDNYIIISFSLYLSAWLIEILQQIIDFKLYGKWGLSHKSFWIFTFFLSFIELIYVSILISKFGENVPQSDIITVSLFFSRFILYIVLLMNIPLLRKSYDYEYEPLEDLSKNPQPIKQESPFKDFFGKVKKLLPFIWPKGNTYLQFLVVLCFVILILSRIVNVFVPVYMKIVVDALAGDATGEPYFPLLDIFIYVGLRFLQGGIGSGFLSTMRSFFWIRVEQFTTREISVDTFHHLHNLSLRYHLQRKTGEVLRVIDRGTVSISQLLSSLVFNILPTFLDIGIAITYFVVAFDIYFGIIVFSAMAAYMTITVTLTEWRTKFRRTMIEFDNDAKQKAVDSLLNFETVKYYGSEKYEVNRYKTAILQYQAADWKSQASLILLNIFQNFFITFGLLAGTLLAASQVVNGKLTVGDFTLFLTYIMQLYAPLNWLGTYYRTIQQNFIDMEKMMALLDEEIEIKDDPNATELIMKKGDLEFKNVNFSYDEKTPSLNKISFKVPGGKTTALVGVSGGGKSTIMRLCFRFYDINSGIIEVDGQDVRKVTQSSLRKSIGVVPQDTVLFNDTIAYNIGYGNVDASKEDIIKAAKAAQIHDKILTFPDGYETKVGERGLRLSGGEKQRVAIARTLLKNPRIVLLDEATSALDTETERAIQDSLAEMSHNRTTLVIAHRLSTIVSADEILVLMKGEIIERGTHEELLLLKGEYHSLWTRQLESNANKVNDDHHSIN